MLSWTLSNAGGPQRACHASVAVKDLIYSFGGVESDKDRSKGEMGVHVFNTVSLCWKELPSVDPGRTGAFPEVPSSRLGHTAVLVEGRAYIWGGGRHGDLVVDDVLYSYDVEINKWLKTGSVSGAVPAGRTAHSACVSGKAMFIHGGFRRGKEVYKLDTGTMFWTLIKGEVIEYGTECHSATMIGTKMFVFGGESEWDRDRGPGGPVNRLRVFDTETNVWLWPDFTGTRPDERYSHSAFHYNGELYIFGGANRRASFKDLWKFNPETSSWRKVAAKRKGPGRREAMSCCRVGERVIIFGGYNVEVQYPYRTPTDEWYVMDLNPSLKTLCKLAVTRRGLDRSGLAPNIRWELAAMG